METTATPDYPRGVTIEEVWAILKENAEQMKETDRRLKETERLIKENAERQKENEKENAERQKKSDQSWEETKRIVRRNSKQMGDLHRRFGELAEHLVAPSINKRFNELGYHFGMLWTGGLKIMDEKGKIKAEVDLVLENDDTLMAVEVKTKPEVKDVEHHIRRLEILRDNRRGFNDKRKIKGAIAGAIFGMEEKKAVIEAGLYVIEQSGDTMKIEVPDGFVPREW